MKKWLIIATLGILIVLTSYLLLTDYDHSNDVIYFGGDIVTMNDSVPSVEAIMVKDGKITAVGSKESVLKLKSENTQLIDLKGKTLLPGFFDAHGHIDIATIFYDMTDISGFTHKTPSSVWETVIEKVKNTPKGEWIYCKGFDPILTKDLQPPTIQFLDSIAPNNPVVLITQALHSYYVNSEALAGVGINQKTPDPSRASFYEKDAKGELTGLIVEPAAFEPFRLKLSEGLKTKFAENTQKLMLYNAKRGVTSTVTMGLTTSNKNILTLYQDLSSEKPKALHNLLRLFGKLPERHPNLRHFVYLRKDGVDLLPENVDNGDDFFKIMGVKLWYDGSPYIGSMYLRKPYIQSKLTKEGFHLTPSHQGEALIKPEEFGKLIKQYQSKGWQVAVHCQGDQAIAEIMAEFEQINRKNTISAYRHRLEHCLLLPQEVMASMKKMNVSPSFHINHILYYGDALKNDILGEERVQKVFPIKTFTAQQVPFSFHADQPMYEADPLSLVSTAVNRTTQSGLVINKNEGITVWKALQAVTIDAAWQLHLEQKLGSIEKGKYADFVILDKNPLKVAPATISTIQVLETIVAGNQLK
jgi:predicted amidohydrolase YtcJ